MHYRVINNGRKNSKFYEFADGTKAASSYETLIAVYKGGILYELPEANCSPTTARHYTDFLMRYDIPRRKIQTISNFSIMCYNIIKQEDEERNDFGRLGALQSDITDLVQGNVRFPQLVFLPKLSK